MPSSGNSDAAEYFWFNKDFRTLNSTMGGTGGQLLHGNQKIYSESGDLVVDGNFEFGLRHGDGKMWNDDGDIIESTHHTQGVKDYWKYKEEGKASWNEWIGPFLEAGSIKKVYSTDNVLLQEEVLLEEFPRFAITMYYATGNVKLKFNNNLGRSFGAQTEYYENGVVKVSGQYDDSGFREGVWKWFDENEALTGSDSLKVETELYDNLTKAKGSYIFLESSNQWVKTDTWFQYDSRGELKELLEYDYGVLKE
jgi:antitoxin component YwqK of YwqJK toxin-antitoxin module